MKKLSLLLVLLSFMITPAILAQSLSLVGKVVDDAGAPLPGATVAIKGSVQVTNTGQDGSFRLNASKGDTLVFSFVGYETQEKVLSTETSLLISLKPAATGLSDVVVIGYGTQSKKLVTSAISKVSGDALKNLPVNSVGDGLKGKIAGAHFYTTNNSPGSDPIIRIRGGSSINGSNEPLILIDGVDRGLGGINPNDIESVEVLKDATAAAIYGARASNGVVLITTKRGSKSKDPRISFETIHGMQMIERTYDYMNAEDYINMVRPAVAVSKSAATNFQSGYSASSGNNSSSIYSTRYLADGEAVPAGYRSMPDPLDKSKTLIFQDNSWVDKIYQQDSWQSYYLSVDGGSEKMLYNASLGYVNDGGVAIATGFKRFTAHANADIHVNKRLKFTTGVDYSQTNAKEFQSQYQVIARGLATPATQKVYFPDGTPTPGYNATSPTPVFYDYYNDGNQKRNIVSLNAGMDLTIMNGLKLNLLASTFNNYYQTDFFQKANPFNGSRPASASFAELQRNKAEGYLSYTKRISRHSLSAIAGYSYQSNKANYLDAAASGASSDNIPTLNAAPVKSNASTVYEEDALKGVFGRLLYDYDKRYLFTFSFRNDASSRFGIGNQWGFFPGVSAGWLISNEDFMDELKTVSTLKLKTSYGRTGNNAIGLYDATGLYSVNNRYNGNAAIIATAMPNQDLTWETSDQLDLGFDLGLWNDRIQLNADYFNKITSNLLFTKTLPNTSGYNSVLTNTGKVKFYGFDIELSSRNIESTNFSWNTRVTWSFVKNKVLKLPYNGNDKNRINGIVITNPDGSTYQIGGIAEGESLYRYYGYMTDGILQTQEAADNARYDELAKGYRFSDGTSIPGRKEVGDYEWKDRNGDNRINGQDMFELGVTVPHSTGGMSNSFRYKQFTLNIYMDWALGHSINDNVLSRYFLGIFANNFQLVDDVKGVWKQTGDNTKYARYTANDTDEGNRNYRTASDVFNYKADYLCLREVSLQYQLSDGLIKRLGISGAAFTLSANNLHYFTAIKGFSPEIGTASPYATNFNTYPAIRKVAIGARITL